MWMTGYEGDVVEDKLKYALNEELGKEWAKVSRKPREIGEQLALLRDTGHQRKISTGPGPENPRTGADNRRSRGNPSRGESLRANPTPKPTSPRGSSRKEGNPEKYH